MKNTEDQIANEFVKNAIYRIEVSSRMIKKSLEKLSEEDLWKKPNGVSNSVGNLLLHLSGNIKQYAIASLTGKEDLRERDKEFSTEYGPGKEKLANEFFQVLDKAKNVIENISHENLLKIREVQAYTLSGIGIIMHVVEHLSYHTGQIAFWTKILTNNSLGFYDGIDLNLKNKN